MSFTELGIAPDLAQAVESLGLGAPLPVQAQAAPVLLAGKSAMLVSRTGSGKTLAYLLPILSRIDPARVAVQAVVLAPTHELAMQIVRVAQELIRAAGSPIRVQALIGGAASSRQIEGLKKKPHLVVGSAGRMVHLMDLGKLKLRDAAWLVFDEADRLLIEENLDDVRRISSDLGAATRFVFVSATEGPATTRVAAGLAPDLEMVRVREERINPAIRHLYLVCEERDKIDWVRKAVRGLEPARTLVFVHRGASAERMAERLEHHHLAVADLHGARDKFARQAALEAFRRGRATVLIASDIAARGLDIAGVELVVNVDAPSQSRDYLHRAGRTGRVGAAGAVLSLMTVAESRLARRYAEDLGIIMEPVRLVRGKLAPAEDDRAQRLEPGPRPVGPGAGRPRPARTQDNAESPRPAASPEADRPRPTSPTSGSRVERDGRGVGSARRGGKGTAPSRSGPGARPRGAPKKAR